MTTATHEVMTQTFRPKNTRRYESVYDVAHMDSPFDIELDEGEVFVDYSYPGWDAGIYVMFPLDTSIKSFLMTAKEFRGKYRLQK